MKEHPIIFNTEMVKAIRDGRKTQTRRLINPQPKQINNDFDGTWEWKEKGQYFDDLTLASTMRETCPYRVGQRLWVRETFRLFSLAGVGDKEEIVLRYKAGGLSKGILTKGINYPFKFDKWRPSIFMPRWASRILLEITELRVERLQNISGEDAKAEGASPFLLDKLKGGTKYKMLKTYHHEFYPLVDHANEGEVVTFECSNMGCARLHHTQWQERKGPVFRIPVKEVFNYVGAVKPDYKNGFRILWNSINAKRGFSWETNPWVWVIEFEEEGYGENPGH